MVPYTLLTLKFTDSGVKLIRLESRVISKGRQNKSLERTSDKLTKAARQLNVDLTNLSLHNANAMAYVDLEKCQLRKLTRCLKSIRKQKVTITVRISKLKAMKISQVGIR
ncbi:hypothetical protein CEXT_332861 [Caerostris extrusa]|uniref:Uncharacterized protein n=1 Tax=Caerostris extrusa TaxID=172846 RepID=A0AAV4MAI2_CAEEX|nr:hypothetical protein CEXT_332861 [Caerostris extrusa]